MFDFSTVDLRLLFPSLSEARIMTLENVTSVINLVGIILIVVAEWKLFKKFGEKSWKSLVPYYNSYILYKHSWSKKAFWVYTASSTLFDITQRASQQWAQNDPASMMKTLFILIGLPFGIVAAVCSILYAIRLAEAFGKKKTFAVGLLLVYSVFIAILGIGKTKYMGNCEAGQKTADADLSIDGETI